MTRVIQISDTHLSPGKRHFAANWAPLAAWTTAQAPGLVIHTGDITVDGADVEADMAHGAACLAEIPVPTLSVPGNHDVGEAGNPWQPVNAPRLERWRRHVGADWWARDVGAWRLIGLNSMIFGSGLEDEARQLAWLEQAAAEAGGRRIAIFTHRPLMLEDPGEPDTGYWSVKPPQRRALLALFDRFDVGLVATGHLHRTHDTSVAGRRYIWSGAGAFLVGPACAPPLPGEAKLGAVVYDFATREAVVQHVEVPGLSPFWIDDVIQEVYPPPPATTAG